MADAAAIQGALIFLSGTVFGAAVRSLPPRRRSPEVSRPACQCGHPRSLHDPATNECHSLAYVKGTASKSAHHAPCRCRQYVGPEPMPALFAPGLELPGGGA